MGRNLVKIGTSIWQPGGSFFLKKIPFAICHHHSGHKVCPIVFILGTNIANIAIGIRSAEIGN